MPTANQFMSQEAPYPAGLEALVAELASDEDRRTSFRGTLNPESP
jgi:hypothetical protein